MAESNSPGSSPDSQNPPIPPTTNLPPSQQWRQWLEEKLAWLKSKKSTWKVLAAVGKRIGGILAVLGLLYLAFDIYRKVSTIDDKIKNVGEEIRREIKAESEKTREEARKEVSKAVDKARREIDLYNSAIELKNEMDSFLCRNDSKNALRKYRLFRDRFPILTIPLAMRNTVFRTALDAYLQNKEFHLMKREEIELIDKSFDSDPSVEVCPSTHLALGTCYLALNDPAVARQRFLSAVLGSSKTTKLNEAAYPIVRAYCLLMLTEIVDKKHITIDDKASAAWNTLRECQKLYFIKTSHISPTMEDLEDEAIVDYLKFNDIGRIPKSYKAVLSNLRTKDFMQVFPTPMGGRPEIVEIVRPIGEKTIILPDLPDKKLPKNPC